MGSEMPPAPAAKSARALLSAGLAGLAVVAAAGVLAPWVAPYDPLEQLDVVAGRFQPPLTVMPAVELANGSWELADRVGRVAAGLEIERLGKTYVRPAAEISNLTAEGVADRRVFVLGSDRFGRDVLSRVIYGARVSLLIAFLSMALSLVIGIAVGALAAHGPRFLDTLVMRFVDGLLAFPWLLLLIFLAAFFTTGPWTLVVILGGTTWMGIARLVRAELLSLSERDFVVAVRGLGVSPWRIFLRHLLPNALTPVLVQAVLQVGNLILFESTLSFLGFGVPKPYATWGNMIAGSRSSMALGWWEGIFPGLALIGTVIALNLATDGLRDYLDPRH